VAGRFLQTDPVGYQSDTDLYAYTGGDPVNKTDLTGNDGNRAESVGLPTSPYADDELESSLSWSAPVYTIGAYAMQPAEPPQKRSRLRRRLLRSNGR
jgi:hypothetical protein